MRIAYSNQLQLDSVPIEKVELNLNCRDSVVPVLKALQHIYADKSLTDRILKLSGNDVSQGTRTDIGRTGMQYWHICVLMAVRLGCNYTYDHLADLAENHRKLRAIMGLGDCGRCERLLTCRTAESSGSRIGDRGIAKRQRLKALPRPFRNWLRALRATGDTGAKLAHPGANVSCRGR